MSININSCGYCDIINFKKDLVQNLSSILPPKLSYPTLKRKNSSVPKLHLGFGGFYGQDSAKDALRSMARKEEGVGE